MAAVKKSKSNKQASSRLKNYDPFEYFGYDEPPDGSNWDQWISGADPAFSSGFAHYCWWQLMQVLGDFICWDRNHKHYKDYLDYEGFGNWEKGGLSLKGELDHALNLAKMAISSVDGFISEYRIEAKVFELAKNDKKEVVQIFAACACIGFDMAISALLKNDAKTSSEYFIFASGCVDILNEYLNEWYPHKSRRDRIIAINAVSNKARENAFKRLANDPKESAMQKIEAEHEALKPHQKTKGYLAPFARDMQKKYSSVLDSPVAIERRIRKLKNSKQAK